MTFSLQFFFVDASSHMIEKNDTKKIKKNGKEKIHWDCAARFTVYFNTIIISIQNDFHNYLCLFILTHFL